MKNYLSVRNLLIVLILTIIPITILYTTTKIKELKKEKAINDLYIKISATKYYDTLNIDQIGLKNAKFKTKYTDSSMLYIFSFDLDSSAKENGGNTLIPKEPGYNQYINLNLMDIDNFDVLQKSIPLRSFTRVVNDDGLTIGYEIRESIVISRDEYLRIYDWRITWNL